MAAYYNEFDPYAAQWLRNLIDSKLIADGDVDDRSIRDVAPGDLAGYTQCHFFAGLGGWSYALRLAGWDDHRPVWTGSCPCQPFSAAGKGKGFDDERHLWPEFHRLIAECRPPVVFGEQVASKDGLAWLDTVQSDMEASGYAIGAADLCAAGIGAPHIRQRLWFVGERLADAERREWRPGGLRQLRQADGAEGSGQAAEPSGSGDDGGLADASLDGRRQGIENGGRLRSGDRAEGSAGRSAVDGGLSGGLADATGGGQPGSGGGGGAQRQRIAERSLQGGPRSASPTNGHWRDADWLHCRDGKWRPVEPGTFPLAHGAPARVGRLRAYGNAIVPAAAAEVIGAYLDARP